MPDPFVIAVALTLLTALLASALDGLGPLALSRAWLGTRERGLWSLLAFSMQMVLILVTGHALAAAPPVARLVRRLADLPRSGAQAAALVGFVAVVCSLLHWGLGLIVGALCAREVGRAAREHGRPIHYPLVCAAGYVGMMTWHGGLSGSAPLKVTTRGDLVELLGPELGASVAPIPFTESVFGWPNLLVTGGLLVFVPLVLAAMAPREAAEIEPAPAAREPHAPDAQGADVAAPLAPKTLPERLERSPLATALVVLLLASGVVVWWMDVGPSALDPNALNLIFLTLGLALHGRLRSYLAACDEAVRGTSGIVLQFPLYAGIMGLVGNTSLGARLAGAVSELATPTSFAVWTFVSSAVLNVFVPSGGGQWALQGPIALRAATELCVEPRLAVMAVSYGDQLTNMLQPFWALPLLGITGVRARDIVGYTVIVMLVGAVWIACTLALVSLRASAGC